MTGGKLLKQLRKEKGMTQEEVSKIIEVNKASIHKVENGLHGITVKNAKQFAKFFNICWIDFFEDDEVQHELSSLKRFSTLELIREIERREVKNAR